MAAVNPSEYPKLAVGDVFVFKTKSGEETGKLLYALNRKNFLLDEKGQVSEEYVLVPHRAGYEPTEETFIDVDGQKLKLYATHLSGGMFSIHRKKD